MEVIGIKKILLGGTYLALLSEIAFADTDMMGYGIMGGTGMALGSIYGLVWFALAVFVFSAIFWSTYKWLIKGKKK